MRSYTFRIMVGQSAPYRTLPAENNAAFYPLLVKYEQEHDVKHIMGTLGFSTYENGVYESGTVPEPLSTDLSDYRRREEKIDRIRNNPDLSPPRR